MNKTIATFLKTLGWDYVQGGHMPSREREDVYKRSTNKYGVGKYKTI